MQEAPSRTEDSELQLAGKCVTLVASFYAPKNSDIGSDEIGNLLTDGQLSLVAGLVRLLDVYEMSHSVITLVADCVVLMAGGNERKSATLPSSLSRSTVNALAQILKKMAKVSMTPKLFDYVGMEAVLRIMEALAQPAIR